MLIFRARPQNAECGVREAQVAHRVDDARLVKVKNAANDLAELC